MLHRFIAYNNGLSTKMLLRDQIWFTEKNRSEQTDLYCLTDIVLPDGTKPRNDANYEKNYIAGRYGAVPYGVSIHAFVRRNGCQTVWRMKEVLVE